VRCLHTGLLLLTLEPRTTIFRPAAKLLPTGFLVNCRPSDPAVPSDSIAGRAIRA